MRRRRSTHRSRRECASTAPRRRRRGCRRRGALRPHRRDPLMERAEADAFDPPAGLADALVDPARGVRGRHDHRVGGVALAGVPLGEQRGTVSSWTTSPSASMITIRSESPSWPIPKANPSASISAPGRRERPPLVGVGDERPEVTQALGVGLLPRPGKWPSMFPLSVTTSAPSSRRTVGVAGADIPFPQSTAIRRPSDRPRTPPRTRADRVEVAVEGVDALRLGPLVPRRRGLLARDAFLDGALGLPVELAAVSEQLDPVVGRRVVRGREHHAVPSLRACASAGVGSRPARSTRTPRTRGPTPSRPRSPDPSRVRHARGRPRRVSSPLQPLVLQPRRRGRQPTRAPVSLAFRRYRGSPRFRTSPYFRCRPAFVRSRRLRVAVGIALLRRPPRF